MRRQLGVCATVLSVLVLWPALASAQQAPQTTYPPWGTLVTGPEDPNPRTPLVMAGYTFDSTTHHSATANIILSRRQGDRDTALWRGPQATSVVGQRGFEVGLGYGHYKADWTGIGYEFRGLAGRPWTGSPRLPAREWYAGAEVTGMFLFFRASAGVVVPVGAASPRTVFKTSIGFLVLFSKRPN